MRPWSFILVMGLTLLYMLATVTQSLMFIRYSHLLARVQVRQNEIAVGQHNNEFARQLVRRMSLVSQTDPAMAQLLQKHGIRIVVKPPSDQDGNTSAPSGANP